MVAMLDKTLHYLELHTVLFIYKPSAPQQECGRYGLAAALPASEDVGVRWPKYMLRSDQELYEFCLSQAALIR